MENDQWENPLQMAIFNSYVKLPEDTLQPSFSIKKSALPAQSLTSQKSSVTQIFREPDTVEKTEEVELVETRISCQFFPID